MNATTLTDFVPLLIGLAVFVLVVWRMNRRLRKIGAEAARSNGAASVLEIGVPPALRFVGDRSGKTSGTSAEAFDARGARPAEDKMRDR